MNYLDTSALVRAWRLKLSPEEVTRAHSVAEFYATLTRGLTVTIAGVRTRVAFSPQDTAQAAAETFANMKFRDLTGRQALDEARAAAKANIQSANIHDWMHAAAADAAGCKAIVTTNEKHFRQVTKTRLVDPSEFFKS